MDVFLREYAMFFRRHRLPEVYRWFGPRKVRGEERDRCPMFNPCDLGHCRITRLQNLIAASPSGNPSVVTTRLECIKMPQPV